MDGLAKFVTAIAYLLWPLLGFYFIHKFGGKIIEFLSRLSEGSVKAFGIEAKVIATNAIVQADLNAEKSETDRSQTELLADTTNQAAEIRRVTSVVTDAASGEFEGKSVLWVDDRPQNNYLEIQALSALGLSIRTVTTTEVAIADLRTTHFDVVISDMKRGEKADAGIELLELMLRLPKMPPVIFYSRTQLDHRLVISQGAFGIATKASDLVILVKAAIQSSPEAHHKNVRHLLSTHWRLRSEA
jgi:CheY-like chemotaxis protein